MIASALVFAALQTAAPLKVGMVGHSLVNHNLPSMIRGIAASKGKAIVVYEQIINGSPLSYNWKNSAKAEKHPSNVYGDLRAEIAAAKPPFDVVILTERVSIAESAKWEDTSGNLILWRNHALKHNPKAQVLFYSTWVGMKEGDYWKDVPDLPTWRKRTELDGKIFVKLANDANRDARSVAGPPIKMAPGHEAMSRLYDRLAAGRMSWLGTNIKAVLADGIHLNQNGNYFMACVMYASIFNESPQGATGTTKDVWGRPLTNLPAAQAVELQKLAWESVSGQVVSYPPPIPKPLRHRSGSPKSMAGMLEIHSVFEELKVRLAS